MAPDQAQGPPSQRPGTRGCEGPGSQQSPPVTRVEADPSTQQVLAPRTAGTHKRQRL